MSNLEILGILLFVGLVIFIAVVRFVVSFVVHRGVDAASNAYKKGKNDQQEKQAKELYGQQVQTEYGQSQQVYGQPQREYDQQSMGQASASGFVGVQPGQSVQAADSMKAYYDVAAAYGIIVHSLGEDYGKVVNVPAPQPAYGQQSQPAYGQQPQREYGQQSQQSYNQQTLAPTEYAQNGYQQMDPGYGAPNGYQQPDSGYGAPNGYQQMESGYGAPNGYQQPVKKQNNTLKIVLISAICVVAVAIILIGAILVKRRFGCPKDEPLGAAVYNSSDESSTADESTAGDTGSDDGDASGKGDDAQPVEERLHDPNGKTMIKLSEIPDLQLLLHMLSQMRFAYHDSCYTSDLDRQYENVIQKLVGNPSCVCFADYDIAQPEEHWDASAPDPRNYVNNKYQGYGYKKISESSVRWVAENILHLTGKAIDTWTEQEYYFYKEDGYYYSFYGGIGDDFHYPEIVGAKKAGGKYYIYYNYVPDPDMFQGTNEKAAGYLAEVSYDTIDGNVYWTIYDELPLGGEATGEDAYGNDADDYMDISGKFDWEEVEHRFDNNDSSDNDGKSASDDEDDSSSDSGLITGRVDNINNGFYGLWIGAWTDKSSAEDQAQQAINAGYDARIFITTDWENLNPDPYYVISAGVYSSQAEAEQHLGDVQNRIIDQAYVKFSGKHKWR